MLYIHTELSAPNQVTGIQTFISMNKHKQIPIGKSASTSQIYNLREMEMEKQKKWKWGIFSSRLLPTWVAVWELYYGNEASTVSERERERDVMHYWSWAVRTPCIHSERKRERERDDMHYWSSTMRTPCIHSATEGERERLWVPLAAMQLGTVSYQYNWWVP